MCFNTKPTQSADRKGAMLPMLAVVMVILIFSVAISVDIARMHLTRSELRTANDAAARAAVVEIGVSQNAAAARDAAIFAASRNKVAGKGLTLTRDQIEIGTADQQSSGGFAFSPTGAGSGTHLTSARVHGKRCSTSPDGEVGMMFGQLFGVDSFCADSVSAATQSHRDIALVLDVSGSMSNEGRFKALADAIDSFLLVLESTPQSENVSLSVYETSARKLQPLTSDLSLISSAFNKEVAEGATAIGLGMEEGLGSVLNDFEARDHALKSLILMTDGNHNTGINPEDIVGDCVAARVSVYTITFKNGADQSRMKAIAEAGNGTHLHAKNNGELEEAFRTIAHQLAVMLIE